MPMNFNFHDNEFKLYNDMQDETVQIHGIPVKYLPRKLMKHDIILGEDPLSFFDSYWDMILYIETAVQFNGQGDLFAKFGLTISDQISLKTQQNRFNTITNNHKPITGDLIFVQMGGWIFEINHVEDEDPWYVVGKPMNYKFDCRMFEYNNEDVQTGIPDIDDLNTQQDTSIDSENDEFEDEIDNIFDTSEDHPFGKL